MGTSARSGHGARGLRALGMLAVLLGLLAMHGLASSHHAPASASEHSASEHSASEHSAAEHSAAEHSAAEHSVAAPLAAGSSAPELGLARGHHRAVAATQQPSALLASPAGSSCEHDCPGAVLALCVAVLAATAALAAAAVVLRRRRRGAVESAPAGVVRAPACARSAFPPPDPVRELCVSRT